MASPLTPEEAIELVKGPFGEAALKEVSKFAFPIFWACPGRTNPGPFSNGSMFLCNFGQGCFGVSANHVYVGFLNDKAEWPKTECLIFPKAFEEDARNAIPFQPEERLIDHCEDPDIATFRITNAEAEMLGTSIASVWPPVPPSEGRGVVFAGYPGHERLYEPPATFNFAIYPALAVATSVSERQISCQFERQYFVQAPGFREPPPNYETGGMSGGPLLTVIEKGGLMYWQLGGVIKEGSRNLEILVASRADFILENGTLRH